MIERLNYNPLPPLHGDEIQIGYSDSETRGPGWYWWATGFDNEKTGPFPTEMEANRDISMIRFEVGLVDF